METSQSFRKEEEKTSLIILHLVTHKPDANSSIRLQSLDASSAVIAASINTDSHMRHPRRRTNTRVSHPLMHVHHTLPGCMRGI